jgi:N-methylhydantoinase B/oxoprolinase/acetone carboxylase alpha subunit
MSIEKPALKGLQRANKARWLKPEIRVRAQHLKARGTLRHATVKALLDDYSLTPIRQSATETSVSVHVPVPGGGYGPPQERDPALVRADVRAGKISPERAQTVYGVLVETDTR